MGDSQEPPICLSRNIQNTRSVGVYAKKVEFLLGIRLYACLLVVLLIKLLQCQQQ